MQDHPAPANETSASSMQKNICHILIVENNEFFRKSFAQILKIYLPNLTIRECINTEEAKTFLETHTARIMFLDIRLPGQNGLDYLKEVKQDYPDMIVNIFTNYDIPEYRELAFVNGADKFLLKDTLSGSELAYLIEKQLKNGSVSDDGVFH